MFRALRVRNFRIYASANLVSLTGTWMQRIGQDWLVLQLSDDSGVALGLITALQFGPTLLLSMYGGVLADRYAKRRMLMITQALMGVLALRARRSWSPPAASRCGTCSCWPAGWARSRPSTPRCGRRSSRRWSARSCWPTRSASTRRSSTAPGWSARRSPGLLIGASSRQHRARPSSSTRPASRSPSARWPACAPTSCGRARRSPGRRGQLRAGLAYTWAHPDLVLAMVLAFVIGTFGFNYQVTIALMARERVRPRRRGVRAALDRSSPSARCSGALLSTRRSVRPRQRFLVGLGGRVRPAHRRRRADAGLRRRSPCCWCPPAPRRWSSAWPTTASSSSASTRRCAAGSWRCTSCASWAARPSAPR